MMSASYHHIDIAIHHMPEGNAQPGRAALADAVLLTITGPVLDTALNLAHDLAQDSLPRRTRRRVLEQAAATLREQLTQIEDQLKRA